MNDTTARRKRRTEAAPASKFQAPKGFTSQSSDAVGYWTDDGESAILFVPRGVKLLDGAKKLDAKKPSCMIIGELKTSGVPLATKDEEFDGQVGDIVGVFWKPGMGREIAQALGVETWIAPLVDEDGERKTRDVGRKQPMKLYDVRFGRKLEGRRLPILDDRRKESRGAPTPFDDPRLAPVRPEPQSSGESPEPDVADFGDDDVPF